MQNLCSSGVFFVKAGTKFAHAAAAAQSRRKMTWGWLKKYCFFGAKLCSSWCKICAHRVQKVLSSFKIVLVAAAKRGGLEVDVCVEDVSWCGVEGWCGTGWISREVGARLVKEQKKRPPQPFMQTILRRHFRCIFWICFLIQKHVWTVAGRG